MKLPHYINSSPLAYINIRLYKTTILHLLTQRISSGLHIDLHLNVSSSIFFALSTLQFLATKYLFKHASLQYMEFRPTKGPNLALSSLICMYISNIAQRSTHKILFTTLINT